MSNNLAELNQKYSIKNRVNFNIAEGGLVKANLTNPAGGTLSLFTYGAHIASWIPPKQSDIFFMSPKSSFQESIAIRGGIPISFPQFAKDGPMISHGFARTSHWEVIHTNANDEKTAITLQLTQSVKTLEIWPNNFFTIKLLVELSQSLKMILEIQNTGKDSFSFACAFHTYFKVSDVHTVSVKGLDGLSYIDKFQSNQVVQENNKEVFLSSACDRIYKNAPQRVEILDPGLKRKIIVEKSNLKDVILWNPWNEGAAKISDLGSENLGSENYKSMLCLETGNVVIADSIVELKSGESFVGMQSIFCC
jgi:glucose-6-phosphate 1-epimerase